MIEQVLLLVKNTNNGGGLRTLITEKHEGMISYNNLRKCFL